MQDGALRRFKKIWFQTVAPDPSWTAFREHSTGTLTVTHGRAEYVSKSGEAVTIENVDRVAKGWKDSIDAAPLLPIVDTRIQILYGDPEDPSVAYVNDARWGGFATYLPNKALLETLRASSGLPDCPHSCRSATVDHPYNRSGALSEFRQ
jgi:hypothetical protein